MNRLLAALVLVAMSAGIALAQDPASAPTSAPAVLTRGADSHVTYKLLATLKTGTMQKELNEAAAEGFRYSGVMGGDTLGGNQVVVILSKTNGSSSNGRYAYQLLATNKTSTMQKEIQAAGDEGFEYCGQTVFSTAFGGDEVVVILERDRDAPIVPHEYMLLATTKTGTMQKELSGAGDAGYEFVGVTVGKTGFGGNEVVTILRRVRTGQ